MSKPQSQVDRPIPCPSCGTPSAGRFCTECGAVVRGAQCANCSASLTPGAKFCHDCGAPAGASRAAQARPARTPRDQPVATNNLPWIVGGLIFVTLVVVFAAQRAGQTPPPASPPMGATGASAVDINSMTPQERASRLFDRIMRLSEEGKRDSVALFASMAIPVYESLGPLDADGRYDFGRVAQVSGNLDIAQAQADSILQQSPTHLLGLILAAAVADARGDNAGRAALERRLLAAEASEQARALEEYTRHKPDIDAALSAEKSRR
jgi:hypothetical protein